MAIGHHCWGSNYFLQWSGSGELVLSFFMATLFLIFRSDSGLQKVLQGSGTESSLMVQKYDQAH